MQCPVDQTTLNITDRSGVEIDWCPTCRGVWLDRGELDKILDRSSRELQDRPTPSLDRTYQHHKPKKKKSFLQNIMEGLEGGD